MRKKRGPGRPVTVRRTTVDLPLTLYKKVKRLSIQKDITLKETIITALREHIEGGR